MKKIVVCIVGIIISVSMILIATFGTFYFVHGYDMENVLKE
ncbi:MAG TPA: peptide ABC transporter permease, partial [Erysipelotrichaceae bacterium]|nr:peptide ABC transporter permease [Erysipelotrichaceae bacterium]